jgi:O-acetyl-ADP-ribose deacetylase (regulator of RNase III)
MIEMTKGNILEADVEAVVNTVNTVGHMGKGIALQFRKAYPENYEAYRKACDRGEVQPGRMFIYDRQSFANPRYIVNFPTKRHWKGKSRMEDIESGLVDLLKDVEVLGLRSVAVPPLGSGLGGLNWMDVRRRLEAAFATKPDVRWIIYEPAGAPAAKDMRNRTKRPKMTKARAAVLGLIKRYLVPGFDYPVSLLEVQKLIYFLKAAGEDFEKVHFVRHHYGPYADVLRHLLDKMEGHFISGYGDGQNSPETPISLIDDAVAEAERFLEDHPDTRQRFNSVAALIKGFESPYGMELLATVHWAATQEDPNAAIRPDAALAVVKDWNVRKAALMKPEHVNAAWSHLKDLGWFDLRV